MQSLAQAGTSSQLAAVPSFLPVMRCLPAYLLRGQNKSGTQQAAGRMRHADVDFLSAAAGSERPERLSGRRPCRAGARAAIWRRECPTPAVPWTCRGVQWGGRSALELGGTTAQLLAASPALGKQ